MTDEGMRGILFSNLESARMNGYFGPGEYLNGATAEEIADDMIAFAEDCSDMKTEEMVPFIKEWMGLMLKS